MLKLFLLFTICSCLWDLWYLLELWGHWDHRKYHYYDWGVSTVKLFSQNVMTSLVLFPISKDFSYINRFNKIGKWDFKERKLRNEMGKGKGKGKKNGKIKRREQMKMQVQTQSLSQTPSKTKTPTKEELSIFNWAKENIYTKLNEEIKTIGKLLVKDDHFVIPKSCFIENNKIHKEFEFQTSIILYLENYIKNGNTDIRKNVTNYIKTNCSDFIKEFFLSDNGILNIKIKENFLMKELKSFYRNYVHDTNAGKKKTKTKTKTNETRKNIVLVDFCSVNIGKHMHIGHLKSLFLGNVISNIFQFFTHSVKKRNHIGDWNVNVALIITFMILFFSDIFSLNASNFFLFQRSQGHTNETNFNMTHTNEQTRINTFGYEKSEYDVKKIKQQDIITYCSNVLKDLNEQIFNEKYQNIDISKYKHLSLSVMETMYKIAKHLYATSDVFINYTQVVLKKMYQKDTKVIGLWNIICSRTKWENEKIFKEFGIKHLIDKGESFYIKYVPIILEKIKKENMMIEINKKWCVLLKKREEMNSSNLNVLNNKIQYYDLVKINEEIMEHVKKKDIVFLKKHFDLLTLKNQSGYTYAAIDLATIYYRVSFEKANEIIYVVDENQRNHFMLVFSIANSLQLIPDNSQCVCINYGYILNEENKKIKTKDISKNVFVKDIIENCKLVNMNCGSVNPNYKSVNPNSESVNTNDSYVNLNDSYVNTNDSYVNTNDSYVNPNDSYVNTNDSYVNTSCKFVPTTINYAIKEKLKKQNDWKNLLLSSIVYSYISVKNWKRQMINTIFQNIHKEYIHILTSYNDVSKFLGKWKNYNISNFYTLESESDFKQIVYTITYPEMKNVIVQILKFPFVIFEAMKCYNIEKICSYLFSLSKNMQQLFQKPYMQKYIQHILKILKKKDMDALSYIILNGYKQSTNSISNKNINKDDNNSYIENYRNVDEAKLTNLQLYVNKIKNISSCIPSLPFFKKEKEDETFSCNEDITVSKGNIYKKNKWNTIHSHLLNTIITVPILQSYLYIVSKTLQILNIRLIKFTK